MQNIMNVLRRTSICALLLACVAKTDVVSAATKIDFSFEDDGVTPLLNGQAINQNEEFGILFEILSAGPNAGAAIFDSTPGINAADPDLWVGLGNILILQSNNGGAGAMTGDFFNNPNDEPDGINTLFFNFLAPVTLEAIDLIDVDQNGPVTVTLTDTQGRKRVYFAPASWTYDIATQGLPMGAKGYDTLDLTTLMDQVGEGGSTATATEDAGFDATSVAQLRVDLDGSGAVDNLVFVPEPSSALLLVAGAIFVSRRRRRIAN
ncbi:MAG: PEP-CTERM sorting domain-containing protein [Phycisphaerales bacterium]|nr:PEP-CTERM sorting domain-containing protein [Phycisphaerales bacterium]